MEVIVVGAVVELGALERGKAGDSGQDGDGVAVVMMITVL